jgi:hypothetical protein
MTTDLQDQKADVTKLIAGLLKLAHHKHIDSVEIEIQRCRQAMWHLVAQSQHHIDTSVSQESVLAVVLNNLMNDLERTMNPFIQKACDLGWSRALTDLQVRGWLKSIHGAAVAPRSLVATLEHENLRYLRTSLLPDMHKSLGSGGKTESFSARIGMYSHWLWKSSERSYVMCMKQYFMVNRD